MSKAERRAKIYVNKRGYQYPVSFNKLNNEFSFIMAVVFFSDLASGFLIGFSLRWVLSLVNAPIPTFDRGLWLNIGLVTTIISFLIGYFYIYFKKHWSNLLNEEETTKFFTRGLDFTHKFTAFMLIWSFAFFFFGV